jgi:hypothetical protein
VPQKCFLIDSLISGCPIPRVYINIKTEGKGREKKTIYDEWDFHPSHFGDPSPTFSLFS